MDYFVWDTGGNVDDPTLCFIDDPPEGMGLHAAKLSLGKPAKPYMPEDPRIVLRKENPGLALPGFIGNTRGMLIFSRAGLDVIEQLCKGQSYEVFPFSLIDHKKRVHTADYVIVNPLDMVECLDDAASGVERDEHGEIESVGKLVLSRSKVENAPHMFRIKEKRVKTVFSEALGKAFVAAGVTNVRGTRLPQV